jgi:lipoprotein-anchoring transpeptidase ErfK/SrfK
LGRIAGGWRQPVRDEAGLKGKIIAYKSYDEIIPLLSTVVGEAPWPSNPIWYQTSEGYIHSAFVQPVENQPSSGPAPVTPPGIWVQVSVPIAETRLKPAAPRVSRKIYYGSVYRAVDAVQDDTGKWWYRLQDGIAYSPGPYVLATSLRYLPPAALSPISPDRADKKIVVDLAKQEITCFEGETPILSARTATGFGVNRTPRGEHEVLRKSHTSYMIGGVGSDHYDLPGVSFPTYFTRSAIAVHGTYWHNDYGRPRSHGCVNVVSDVAQFAFRWTSPAVPYDQHQILVKRGEGTKVVVVN